MENVKVIICYDNEKEFDTFLDMTDEEVLVLGENTGNIYSLQGFQTACNTDGYINTSSYLRFIE